MELTAVCGKVVEIQSSYSDRSTKHRELPRTETMNLQVAKFEF